MPGRRPGHPERQAPHKLPWIAGSSPAMTSRWMEVEIGGRRAGVTHAPAVSCHQACKPGSVPREGRWPFILGAPCGAPHATNPGGSSESRLAAVSRSHAAPIRSCSRWGLPCRPCYQERGALLPHPFTLTPRSVSGPKEAVCFLWHCPWGCPRRRLSGTVLPWSPDFPLRLDTQNMRRSGHPAC